MRNAVIIPSEGVFFRLQVFFDIIRFWLPYESALEITGAHRPSGMIPDSGVHSTNPLRAYDLCIVDLETRVVAPSTVHEEIVTRLNAEWLYDPAQPEKPVAFWHEKGRGWHIHLQAHENSRRK